MSNSHDKGTPPSAWSGHQSPNAANSDIAYLQGSQASQTYSNWQTTSNSRSPHSVPPASSPRLINRPGIPTRASTIDTIQPDYNLSTDELVPHARSEDLNHSGYSSSSSIGASKASSPFLSSNPTSTGSKSQNQSRPGTAEHFRHRGSEEFSSSTISVTFSQSPGSVPSLPSTSLASATCFACTKPLQGAFVRALGSMYHLNCFKCLDCGDVVASKFFPIDGPDGKQLPLCERDYFHRLNLICAKCGMALRGSYITACNKKFHVEHFTCSLCSTLFGPQDSYYEHGGDVYCHFHYSTRFATKCAGCSTAILKQFVEINRNMRDECWHPECYMINKFWNVRVSSKRPTSSTSMGESDIPEYLEEEKRETHESLKNKQVMMEQQVYRVWTVLSAFEESSAACISDMLRQVSSGQYLEAIRMAEKFILHVEVLFAAIDDLEYHFARLNMKGMSHVREARLLCRKSVDLFTLLSRTQETGERRMGMTQELLALVTGLAHYLKILIRIALTGALKLERDQSVQEAMASFLDKLHLLAVQGGNPSARRIIRSTNGGVLPASQIGNAGTQGVTYGFRSLAPENAGESPFASNAPREGTAKVTTTNPPSDLCIKCNITVEEDCVRLGTYQRWHSHCVQCATCGKVAAPPTLSTPKPDSQEEGDKDEKDKAKGPKVSSVRRPPADVDFFVFEVSQGSDNADIPRVIFCVDHGHMGCRSGFQAVTRLEQYAYLLNVALRRLYLLLKKQGVVPLSPVSTNSAGQSPSMQKDLYRSSPDLVPTMRSVHLNRKSSATARLPKRSTVVESPTGKSAHPDAFRIQRSQELGISQPQRSAPQVTQPPQGQQAQQVQQGQRSPLPPSRSPPGQFSLPRSITDKQGGVDFSQPTRNLRPPILRNDTEVKIVDDSMPNSPAGGVEESSTSSPVDNGITLADIPQLVGVAQAREQHRSLPRENSIPYIAELSPQELTIVKHAAVLALSRSPLKDRFDLDEILELLEVKKGGFWNKLFKPGNNKNSVKKKGVFNVPLELLVEREGVDSYLGATNVPLRIPSFIDDVISAMRQMDLSIEGIFRKNGNIRRLKDLSEAIDRDPSSVDLSQDNPVQLAALLKKFLRELPEPLLTFKLHHLFIATQSISSEEERLRMLHLVYLILPKSHRDTLEVLFVFLKWVASFAHMDESTGSKMDVTNLATVICPSILYSRGRDAVRDESFGAIRVVTSLLECQDLFNTVPEEFLSILHDQEYFTGSMELSSKDFLKKCDTYMRLKFNGRPPASNSLNIQDSRLNLPVSPNPEGSAKSVSPDRIPRSFYHHPSVPTFGASPIPSSPALSQSTAVLQPAPSANLPAAAEDWPANFSRPASRPVSIVQPGSSGENLNSVAPNGFQSQPALRQRT